MSRILWMTDPHFQTVGTIDGLDPRKRLTAAIDFVNTHYADADFAVMSGDLVGDDVDADYPEIANYLARCHVPVHAIMGNNDDRDRFRTHLPLPKTVMHDFIQYTVDRPEGLFIFLDTHKVGSHAGALCAARREWLAHLLRQTPDKPAFIFMHHPPLALGLPPQDEIMLDDADAFLTLVQAHDNVAHLFMGHVHRTTSGMVKGIPFATLGAVSFQAPPPRPLWDWDTFEEPKDAPQLAVIEIENGNVIVQYMPFCSYKVGIA